jgi:SNF2 family DNA or RNA helicase
MAATVIKCPHCGRVAREKSQTKLPGKVVINLECGHVILQDAVVIKKEGYAAMVSKDGRSPYEYQVKTAEFGEGANLNYICGHEMGLGKTVIECILLSRHLKDLSPTLIVCKSGLRMQYWAELYRWAGVMAQIIESSSEKPLFDMFEVFLISFDSLRLVRPVLSELDKALMEQIPEEEDSNVRLMKGLGMKRGSSAQKWDDDLCSRFNHIAIDETQQIKNPSSSRTQSLMSIVQAARRERGPDGEWRPKKKPLRIAGYSGTPIMNRPSEFWTMLHMVDPTLFPYFDSFKRNEVKYSQVTGKEVGLRDPERFHEKIKHLFIRFERAEVLPDLPKINRMFQLADMQGNFLEAYKRTVKEFQEFMDIQEKSPSVMDILGWLSRMRHITGMAKVNEAIEFTEEFLLSNNRKLVIFLHHKEVAKAIMEKLSRVMREGDFAPPLLLNAELDMRQRHDVLERFKEPENRVLIASQLAAGEGLNMQFCSDCLMVERQWNPAKEEQCEARFPRPGSTAEVVNVWYLIAAGTIDDFLTELVEQKRAIVKQVMDGEETVWEENSLVVELAEVIRNKGLKKFESGVKKEKGKGKK